MEQTPLTYEEKQEEEEAAHREKESNEISLCRSKGVFGSSAEAGDGPWRIDWAEVLIDGGSAP